MFLKKGLNERKINEDDRMNLRFASILCHDHSVDSLMRVVHTFLSSASSPVSPLSLRCPLTRSIHLSRALLLLPPTFILNHSSPTLFVPLNDGSVPHRSSRRWFSHISSSFNARLLSAFLMVNK